VISLQTWTLQYERRTERNSTKEVIKCDLPIRFNASSKKSTSMRTLEMAFSFIIVMPRPVKKSLIEITISPKQNQRLLSAHTMKQSAMYDTAPL
jgi:hypothetical protein